MRYLSPTYYFTFVLLTFIVACGDPLEEVIICRAEPLITETSTQEEDIKVLSDLYNEITSTINTYSCTNGMNWTFTVIGYKACGGPKAYIALPKELKNESFLTKIACYTSLDEIYSNKYDLSSTCDITKQPTSVSCENGKPILVYS